MKVCKILLIFSITLFAACAKDSKSPNGRITGTWLFNSQQTVSYPYPTYKTNPYPVSTSSQTNANGDVSLTFSSNGNYSFAYKTLPVDKGTYAVVYDSLLVITPEVSDFVKFNYTIPQVIASPEPLPNLSPYYGFKFSSDTIHFKVSSSAITFETMWLSVTPQPLMPSGDTLLLNRLVNTFKKK